MSATDWKICPKCKNLEEVKYEAALAMVDSTYGQVPAEEYISAREQVIASKVDWDRLPEKDYTLREDYNGVGVDVDGVFSIEYEARCSQCTFSYEYKHIEMAYDGT